jgi:hypothetical protein
MSKNLLPRFAKLCQSWRDFGKEIDVLQTCLKVMVLFSLAFLKTDRFSKLFSEQKLWVLRKSLTLSLLHKD